MLSVHLSFVSDLGEDPTGVQNSYSTMGYIRSGKHQDNLSFGKFILCVVCATLQWARLGYFINAALKVVSSKN
jgi:hypothetical protein